MCKVHAVTALALAGVLGIARPARAQDENPVVPKSEAVPAPTSSEARNAPEKQKAIFDPALHIEPFLSVVGGGKLDNPINRSTEHNESRISALALSDFGVRGGYNDWIGFESELMANGGTDLHGSSAFEGQASLQVRNQLVRLTPGAFLIEAGRVTDEASIDYFSDHVADVFLQDTATRNPLLYSGYNLGNGVRATYKVVPWLRVGLTLTAGNPTSSTASLMIGGTYPPNDRLYLQPYQYVGKDAQRFPDDSFHMMLFAPSLLLDTKYVDARVAFQGFTVDTDTTKTSDQNVRGFNLRGTTRVKLLDEMIVPFANFAVTRNDTVDPTDVTHLQPDKYTGLVFGGGIDFNYAHPFVCTYACANGVGAQYEQVEYQTGSGPVTHLHFINVGTTYWLSPHVALGARISMWINHTTAQEDGGERSALVTLRFVM